jgi:hypothetical protein
MQSEHPLPLVQLDESINSFSKENAMSLLFGERSLSKVAGIFEQGQEARIVAEEILHDGSLTNEQVQVLVPDDPATSHKLEPEEAGIVHTLIRSHIALGSAGLMIGLLFGALLVAFGVPFAESSPYYTILITAGFGAVFGMMFGGLVSLRPDHDPLIAKVETETHAGHWAVVVHPLNHEQEMRARDVITHAHGKLVHTF